MLVLIRHRPILAEWFSAIQGISLGSICRNAIRRFSIWITVNNFLLNGLRIILWCAGIGFFKIIMMAKVACQNVFLLETLFQDDRQSVDQNKATADSGPLKKLLISSGSLLKQTVYSVCHSNYMILSFRTDMSGQIVQTQIRLEQSDQGLHCLPFCVHLLDSLFYGGATLFNF